MTGGQEERKKVGLTAVPGSLASAQKGAEAHGFSEVARLVSWSGQANSK